MAKKRAMFPICDGTSVGCSLVELWGPQTSRESVDHNPLPLQQIIPCRTSGEPKKKAATSQEVDQDLQNSR